LVEISIATDLHKLQDPIRITLGFKSLYVIFRGSISDLQLTFILCSIERQ